MGNTVTVEDAARLEGMSLYQGALVTRENASVTFSGTEAKASGQWNIGADTELALENSTLDLTEAGVDGNVILSGSSGITGDKGTLRQTLLDDARVTYTDRNVKAGEIRSVGSNVTITLNNSSMHFDGEIPEQRRLFRNDYLCAGRHPDCGWGYFPAQFIPDAGASPCGYAGRRAAKLRRPAGNPCPAGKGICGFV